jgi:putative transposase
VVAYLCTAYAVSERRACRTVRCARATYHDRSHRDPGTRLRQRIREMAQTRVRYGYRKIRVLRNREGWAVGKKLVYRLYREEGLMLRHRVPRRRKSVAPRWTRPKPGRPNEAWTLDVVADQLANGQRFRALTVVDVFTRERVAMEVGQSLRGEHVVTVLNRLTARRGAPTVLFCDNGSEFCSQIVDLWAYQHKVRLDFSRPGKPTDNAQVESFNATLRRECLNAHWFESLHEAKERIETWRQEYNESRPHRALQDRTPEEFARAHTENHLCEPLITAGNSP